MLLLKGERRFINGFLMKVAGTMAQSSDPEGPRWSNALLFMAIFLALSLALVPE